MCRQLYTAVAVQNLIELRLLSPFARGATPHGTPRELRELRRSPLKLPPPPLTEVSCSDLLEHMRLQIASLFVLLSPSVLVAAKCATLLRARIPQNTKAPLLTVLTNLPALQPPRHGERQTKVLECRAPGSADGDRRLHELGQHDFRIHDGEEQPAS